MRKNKDDRNLKKRNLNKRFLIGAILALVLSFAIGFFIYGKGDREPLIAENYSVEDDSVASIAKVAADEFLMEINPIQEEGKNLIQYVYQWGEQSQNALDSYVKYLEDEAGFVSLEDETKEQESEETAEDGETSTPMYSLAAQSKEENKLFKIEITQGKKDYTITVFREEGQLPEEDTFTRDQAKAYLRGFLDEKKELSQPVDDYTYIFDVGRALIQNEECYGVSIYKKGESQCNEIEAKYYISLKEKNIYRYDLHTGDSIKISE